MIALVLAVALSTLPECTQANLGQCIDFTAQGGDGETCEQTPMGLGWVGSHCPKSAPTVVDHVQVADVPLANPDAKGTATVLVPGADYVNLTGHKVVVLDEQEDASRERNRVEGWAGEAFWRKVAIGSITGGAVLLVTTVVIVGAAAAHKL